MYNKVASIIRQERRRQKLTLRDLSQKTGIDYSMLSKYENGNVMPPPAKLSIIAEALGIDEDYLKPDDYEMLALRRHFENTDLDDDKYVISEFNINKAVIRAADGRCELCGQWFQNGEAFLETHHVVWLRDGGTPTFDNTVALCPNCHKYIHISQRPEDVKKLIEAVKKHK